MRATSEILFFAKSRIGVSSGTLPHPKFEECPLLAGCELVQLLIIWSLFVC